jgi:predicted acylesterase/phospholipase RssA
MIRLAVLALALLAACTPPPPRDPDAAPVERYRAAEVPGFPDVRAFYDGTYRPGRAELAAFIEARRAARLDPDRFTILALSGGGADGAYGAGFLKGWTEHGSRPVFDVVTGVSTGALIAPFAFLGSDYDGELEAFYTGVSTDSVLTFTLFRAVFGGSAVADTEPLRQILMATVNTDLTARIAAEHRKGRRLLVATTNIDSQRPVIWDLGAIAATGRPDAPALIRKVVLASASIPGAFPPVLFPVEANGEAFQEVHVDGGVTLSIFAYPPSVNLGSWRMRWACRVRVASST